MSSRKQQILDIAEQFTQERGVNGFSYHDIANQINIKTSSLHYHFKTKNELMLALVKRYHSVFIDQFIGINQLEINSYFKLLKFSEIFSELAQCSTKFCLCGMMAAEWGCLSNALKQAVLDYFQYLENELSKYFKDLNASDCMVEASCYLSILEGALLIARTKNEPNLVSQAAKSFLSKYI